MVITGILCLRAVWYLPTIVSEDARDEPLGSSRALEHSPGWEEFKARFLQPPGILIVLFLNLSVCIVVAPVVELLPFADPWSRSNSAENPDSRSELLVVLPIDEMGNLLVWLCVVLQPCPGFTKELLLFAAEVPAELRQTLQWQRYRSSSYIMYWLFNNVVKTRKIKDLFHKCYQNKGISCIDYSII
jgi:hypothetical protein